MKFLKYNIDSQSFENLYILNILNTSYRSNHILQCAEKICYKVIDGYLSNIHFHNTDTLIACNTDTLIARNTDTLIARNIDTL